MSNVLIQLQVPAETYALAQKLAERCEWSIEKVIHQALEDATDLQNHIEECDAEDLRRLEDFR